MHGVGVQFHDEFSLTLSALLVSDLAEVRRTRSGCTESFLGSTRKNQRENTIEEE
jgi:hypothetical protein